MNSYGNKIINTVQRNQRQKVKISSHDKGSRV